MRQHILQMEVLNDHVRHLPTLKDRPKAVPMMKIGDIPFGKADLAAIVMASVPMSWQNQYNLNHSAIPKSTHTLLPDLEAMSKSWLRSAMRCSRQKVRQVQPNPKPRVTRSARRLGARLVDSLRRVAVRFFASVARPMVVPTRPSTNWTAVAMTAMVSPSRQQQVSPLSPRSPAGSLGEIRAWPSCRPCLRLMQNARRKLVSLRSTSSVTMTSVTVCVCSWPAVCRG